MSSAVTGKRLVEGRRVMVGARGRKTTGIRRRWRAAESVLAATAPLLCGSSALAAAGDDALSFIVDKMRLDPQNAAGFALLMGLTVFATTTALLHLRERA